MCDSNSNTFSFGTSSSSQSGRERGFTFSAQTRARKCYKARSPTTTSSGCSKTTSSSSSSSPSPSLSSSHQPSEPTPSVWRFTFPSSYPEELIKKKKEVKSEPSRSPSSQIVIVSRILKGIPQNPHFLPLRAYSEVSKQSLIKSWDHIFEQTTDKIQSMQVKGFWVDAKRLWETIQELQDVGYNVIPLRRRLVELTDVMAMLRKHRSDIRGLREKAEQHRLEKSRLEYEIVKFKARVEAEKVGFEDVMARVAKMEDQLPTFDDVFSKLAIKML